MYLWDFEKYIDVLSSTYHWKSLSVFALQTYKYFDAGKDFFSERWSLIIFKGSVYLIMLRMPQKSGCETVHYSQVISNIFIAILNNQCA